MVTQHTLIRLDAAFELALGTLLVVAWPLGWFELAGFERGLAAAFGAVLIAVGVILWITPPTASLLQMLAAANAGGAALFVAWLLIGRDGFDPLGATLVALTAAALAMLAAAEWVTARASEPEADRLRIP